MKKKYQTGSAKLNRKAFFNPVHDLDFEVPDGDVEIGRKVYNAQCAGCHHPMENKAYGPKLHNIFGKTAGTQKGYKAYSLVNKTLGFQWSRQRLYLLLDNPEQVLGINSNMMFSRLTDTYEKVCLIEYLHHLRIHTSPLVKPEWTNSQIQ